MTGAWLKVGVVALITFGSAVPAAASRADIRVAKRHFRRAQVQYKLGNFDQALSEYSKAYEAKALPAFLFNIGQCHMELQHYERAIFFFQGYLREKPDAANRTFVESRIHDAQAALAKQQAAKQRQQAMQKQKEALQRQQESLEKQRLAQQQQQIVAQQAADRARAQQLAEASLQAKARAPSPFYKTWWFWSIVGGVVVVGGGTAAAIAAGGHPKTVLPSGALGTIDAR